MTKNANLLSSRLIISDPFENNHNNWELDSNDLVKDTIANGSFQKTLKTDHAESWDTVEIPGVSEKNFGLTFDVQLVKFSDNAEVILSLEQLITVIWKTENIFGYGCWIMG